MKAILFYQGCARSASAVIEDGPKLSNLLPTVINIIIIIITRGNVHLTAMCFCFSWSSVMELSPCKKILAQILSGSFSSTLHLLKSFLFPGTYRTGGRL